MIVRLALCLCCVPAAAAWGAPAGQPGAVVPSLRAVPRPPVTTTPDAPAWRQPAASTTAGSTGSAYAPPESASPVPSAEAPAGTAQTAPWASKPSAPYVPPVAAPSPPAAPLPSAAATRPNYADATLPRRPAYSSAYGLPPQRAPSHIHPAVVRVVAPGDGSVSYGSGTLVDVNGDYGLVITNYHVINEATGNISVVFPDGFYSLATVRKVDKDWDLAALVIRKPNVEPVPVASVAPKPGEPLTIAGYGSGNYRAVTGRCTQYVAPGSRMPFEMVELAARARQGDSGGPILNSRGELAGVLFGEGGGRTAGSYCGRVKWFMASLTDRPQMPDAPGMPAVPTPPGMPSASPEAPPTAIAALPVAAPMASPADAWPSSSSPTVRLPRTGSPAQAEHLPLVNRPADAFASRAAAPAAPAATPTPVPAPRTAEPLADREVLSASLTPERVRPSLTPPEENLDWKQLAGDTLADQVKTYLAIVGCCAVLLHALKAAAGGK